jgi:hypothetical protein
MHLGRVPQHPAVPSSSAWDGQLDQHVVAGCSRPPLPGRGKVANSAIMLVMRALWLERNSRVIDKVNTPAARVLADVLQDWAVWLASRRGHSGGV